MKYSHVNQGTCSSQVDFEINDEGIITNVQFYGGCHGNLQGIAALVRGMKASEVADKLQDIRCGYKNTSCPDQLSRALREAIAAK